MYVLTFGLEDLDVSAFRFFETGSPVSEERSGQPEFSEGS